MRLDALLEVERRPRPLKHETIGLPWEQRYRIEDRGYETPCFIWARMREPLRRRSCRRVRTRAWPDPDPLPRFTTAASRPTASAPIN